MLYQAELHPDAAERSHSMAVGTDQLALRDLIQNRRSAKTALNHVAHFAPLRGAGQMIPLHGRVVERSAAVGTALPILERSIPRY